ncbi:(2Fe-2S)-binding protein [Sporosarcina cyprini]|uniref:(2Fe-2S)-binding protein n=1 Tax=Sporosarcina cyprini TaxID=2910523 RepID=UPI001EDE594F|nr:(2Fe-2S)-binding protein [Sporosarcina cyprini]MCG3088034.1 (2Fe-2S)-binding protein [Sporosarcina cyprini]
MTKRIIHHPVLDQIDDTDTISFTFDNQQYSALHNESIAAALLANGIRTLRHHEETGTPRGIYCNIGHCFECRVTVDGKQGVRACLTPVQEGMDVKSGDKLLTSVRDWRANNE